MLPLSPLKEAQKLKVAFLYQRGFLLKKVCYKCENCQRRSVHGSRPIVFHLYFGQNETTLQRGFSAIAELLV